MARKKKDIVVSNEAEEILDNKVEETPQPDVEISDKTEETLDSKVEEIPQSDIEDSNETVPEEGQATQEGLLDDLNSPDQDVEPETQSDSEESITSEKEEENLDYVEDLDIVDGEVYVVKCNKFISNKLSRYEVRISTPNGFRKYKKTSRDKACYLANQMNKARGIINKLKIVE